MFRHLTVGIQTFEFKFLLKIYFLFATDDWNRTSELRATPITTNMREIFRSFVVNFFQVRICLMA